MDKLGFGVIGAGYMGKAFSIALAQVGPVFGLGLDVRREMIATSTAEGAARHASAFGFARSTGDWRELVADPDVDVVAIATPPWLHAEQAKAAFAAGKHVLCEKPLGRSAAESAGMARAAREAGVVTGVGFNYMKNPATQLAREMIAAGEIGEVTYFRGTHVEDYLLDPDTPHSWRLEQKYVGRAGALGDVATHIVNMAHFLLGPIAEVVGTRQTVISDRPSATGMKPVENEDQAQFLVRFESGVPGSIDASRVHGGRKMGLGYEVVGTKGTLSFDQERLMELKYYDARDPALRQGVKTILAAPGHGDYGRFNAGPAHGFGFNDMVTVEFADFIRAIRDGGRTWPDFDAAVHTDAVIEAVLASDERRAWVPVAEIEAAARGA